MSYPFSISVTALHEVKGNVRSVVIQKTIYRVDYMVGTWKVPAIETPIGRTFLSCPDMNSNMRFFLWITIVLSYDTGSYT